MPADTGEKTEPPSPRRRREAREKGQVARSQDLAASVLLLVGFLAMALFGPGLWQILLAMVQGTLRPDSATDLGGLMALSGTMAIEVGKRLSPILLTLFVATVATLYAQIGPLLTWQPLTPSLGRLNPINGIKRLLSIRSVMLVVINVGKLLVVALVAYLTIMGSAAAIIFASTLGSHDLVSLGSELMLRLGIRISVALLLLALLDFAWQRYRHEKDLRMTKEEVKDEMRSMEGDPALKRRRRQVQLQIAMQRLRKDVPTADVVVTNPTHVAVAIRYDVKAMSAPKVAAKGADLMALRIRQIATEFGVPIVERKPLARALYEAVEVGQYIPERFYQAVAQILAYVYELTGRSPLRPRRDRVEVK